jgi:hypothetical protein
MPGNWQLFQLVSAPTHNGVADAVAKLTVLTFWHPSFTFNSNKSLTWCKIFQFIILTFVYSSTCFGRFSSHHQELNDCSWQPLVLPSYRGVAVLCSWSGRPAGRPDHEHKKKTDSGSSAVLCAVTIPPADLRSLSLYYYTVCSRMCMSSVIQ